MDKYIDSKFIILYFEMYCFITPTPFQEIKREKEREIKLQYKKKNENKYWYTISDV